MELSFIFPQKEHVHHSLSMVFPQNEHSQVAATGRDGSWVVVVVLPALFLIEPLIGLDVRSTTALVRLLLLLLLPLLALFLLLLLPLFLLLPAVDVESSPPATPPGRWFPQASQAR